MKKIYTIATLFAVSCLAAASISFAKVGENEFWEQVFSPAGLFATDMRLEHEIVSNHMLIGGSRAVYHEEISSVIDHRPYKNVFKNYSVSIDQTLGPMLEHRERAWLARREVDDLIKSYASFDYVIQNRTTNYGSIYKGEDITLIYEDPDFGTQAVIFAVKVGAVSKYKQIAIVPIDFMEDREVTQYLLSLRFEEGIVQTKEKVLEQWETITSPHRIFSVMIPPKVSPFFEKDPVIRKSDNASVIRYVFRDPVRRQNIYYNLYEYKVDKDLSFDDVKSIIGKYHVEEHRRDPSVIKFIKQIEKKKTYLEAKYSITPTKKIPYIKMVQLRAFFEGKNIFVQEVISSDILGKTPFVSNFLSLYKFHPEYATPLGADAVDTRVRSGIEGTMEAILSEGDAAALVFEEQESNNEKADENVEGSEDTTGDSPADKDKDKSEVTPDDDAKDSDAAEDAAETPL